MATARPALLDVNVLIALLDQDHLHHRHATDWLRRNIRAGWASCAITQNGCVRVLSQPGYANPVPTAQAALRLRAATRTAHHHFVQQSISLLDPARFDVDALLGHRQLTDAYLLGLAAANGLRFASFDAALPLKAVKGATKDMVVVL